MANKDIAAALMKSFHKWGKTDSKYKTIYKRVDKRAFIILSDALAEIDKFRPDYFMLWWARHHMRYNKRVNPKHNFTQEDKNRVHQMGSEFLSLYRRGKLGNATTAKA